jgi:hypothetical protein
VAVRPHSGDTTGDASLKPDVSTKSLVWRGIAENTLNKNGNKNQQMVEKAVQKMFKQWPK